jgi:membrane protein implicated in regulation of membrane protease activity
VPILWLVLWVLVAILAVVAEVFTSTFVLLMFGIGALAAAGAAGLGAPLWAQVLVFGGVSGLALFGIRPLLRRHLHLGGANTPMGVEAIEGSTGLVLEQVDADQGLIKIDGETWRAKAYDATQVIPAGERVRVIEIKGATALVWRD